MKKLIAIMLALICFAGLFASLSGCKPKQKLSAADEIVIGIPSNLMIEDFETNALTLWLEEQSGYKLTFQQYASSPADYRTALSVQMLDPTVILPHVLIHFDLPDIAWREYGDDEYFVDLTDLMMDKEGAAKNFWDMAEEYFDESAIDLLIRRCSSDDGSKVYAVPFMEKSQVDPIPFLAHINKKWLEQVNMPAPTNTEELYNVLIAFRDQICKNQTYYPMLCGNASEIGGDGVWWLIAMFCPQYNYDYMFGLSEDGTQLTTPFTSEEFRQGLSYVRRLMAEGLLPDNSLTMSHQDVKNIVNNKDGSRVGVLIGHATPVFNAEGNANLYDYVPLNLYPSNQYASYPKGGPGAFITAQAEAEGKVEACWNMLMNLYTKEGAVRVRYGDEDLNWTWVEEGEDVKSYLGYDCWINLLDDPFSRPNNEMWGTPKPTLNPQAEGEFVNPGTLDDWMKYRYSLNGDAYHNFYAAQKNNGYTLPDIVLTEPEENTIKYTKTNTYNEFKSWYSKFVKDSAYDPMNPTVWAQYIDALNKQGLQDWKAVVQNAYTTRYMSTVIGSK